MDILDNHLKFEEAATRDGFGEALLELGSNPKVLALTADLAESTRVAKFAQKYPDRFFDVGVAEQNLVGVAAGLGLDGWIPFASSYAVFSPGRSWDQIRVSICYANSNVKIVGSHAGLTVGEDGATHQALEDIAITRVLPKMTVVVPCDSIEAKKATFALSEMRGPAYLRLGREKQLIITNQHSAFELGKAITLARGSDVTVIACGRMVFEAMRAAHLLKDEKSVRVINLHTIKPIDVDAIVNAAKETGAIVTAEEHQVAGGLGSAVSEVVGEHYSVPVIKVGVKDTFGESGTPDELLHAYGLTAEHIITAIHMALKKKDEHAR